MPKQPWTIRRWDYLAPIYDRLVRLDEPRRKSVELAAIQPGERVLISGCGTGADIPFIHPEADIVAGDLNAAMLTIARDRALSLGRAVSFRELDAIHLALPAGEFDVVLLHLIVAVVPDHLAVLQEAARVVKPSGRVVVFDKYFSGPGRPNIVRRLLNPIARRVATDLNVRLLDLAQQAGLSLVREVPLFAGGLFRAALFTRVQPSSNSNG